MYSGTPTSTASPCRPLEVASTAPLPEKPRPLPCPAILESPPGRRPPPPPLPSLPASLPSRLLRPIVLPRRPAFLVSPFSSLLGWTCDAQCFSITSPSRWKMFSFDRWTFHLLMISVDTWARGIRRSVTESERQTQKWKTMREPMGSPRMAEAVAKGW